MPTAEAAAGAPAAAATTTTAAATQAKALAAATPWTAGSRSIEFKGRNEEEKNIEIAADQGTRQKRRDYDIGRPG